MNYRLALLKIPPDRLSDRDLATAATYILAERTTIGVERVHEFMRELYRRGMNERGISRLTGFRLHVVFVAVHRRPPRLEVQRPPSR